MIHLIYIYFILNAIIAGGTSMKFMEFTKLFLFGVPIYLSIFIYHFSKNLYEFISVKLILKGWYKLYFTDEYSQRPDDSIIENKRKQYWGLYEGYDSRFNSNWYQRLFIRKLDSKYNHGLTKPY